MELHVFDFDGTLFRSPAPNPALHDRRTLEMIAQPRSNKGYGWFQHLATLSPPYVPDSPAADDPFFIQEIVGELRKAQAQGFPTAVLTGRDEKYRTRIQAILASGGIAVDEVILKPGENSGTVKYKAQTFLRLARKFNPKRIVYYEDRVDQGKKIVAAVRFLFGEQLSEHELRGLPKGLHAPGAGGFAGAPPAFDLVMVPESVKSDTHLPPELERQLLEQLLAHGN
jgi:hypothetical protein